MGYEIIVVTPEAQNHFNKVAHHAEEKALKKFENPHIEKLWCDKVGHHDFLYQAHIKTGHLGNHHHFTVLWEVRGSHNNEHVKLIDVQEGHKTIF